MTGFRRRLDLHAAIVAGALLWTPCIHGHAQQTSESPEKHDRARVSIATPLPRLDGDHLRATLVEVYYGPGEASPQHSHPCAVVGYVVQGAIRTQVQGESLRFYKAGDSFYEPPNGVHAVSANASNTEPAKFVAYFVCDREGPLSTDVPTAGHDARQNTGHHEAKPSK
jgi:quercetin dioxygenase-like cupin family protein